MEFGFDWVLGFAYGEFCYGVDDPLEAVFAYGVEVGVGGRIHGVDGVGDAVFYGELYRVEVVAEGLAEGEGVFFDALQELLVVFGGVEDVTALMRAAGVVGHDADFRLADDIAAEVLLEVDCGLKGHAEVAGLVVGVEELVAVVDVVDVAPAAAIAADSPHLGKPISEARAGDLPLLSEAAALAQQNFVTGASIRNWASYGHDVTLQQNLPDWQRHLLTDPQTLQEMMRHAEQLAQGAALPTGA